MYSIFLELVKAATNSEDMAHNGIFQQLHRPGDIRRCFGIILWVGELSTREMQKQLFIIIVINPEFY